MSSSLVVVVRAATMRVAVAVPDSSSSEIRTQFQVTFQMERSRLSSVRVGWEQPQLVKMEVNPVSARCAHLVEVEEVTRIRRQPPTTPVRTVVLVVVAQAKPVSTQGRVVWQEIRWGRRQALLRVSMATTVGLAANRPPAVVAAEEPVVLVCPVVQLPLVALVARVQFLELQRSMQLVVEAVGETPQRREEASVVPRGSVAMAEMVTLKQRVALPAPGRAVVAPAVTSLAPQMIIEEETVAQGSSLCGMRFPLRQYPT
jgi:hypothetical protein